MVNVASLATVVSRASLSAAFLLVFVSTGLVILRRRGYGG
jgi:hypothetical protein